MDKRIYHFGLVNVDIAVLPDLVERLYSYLVFHTFNVFSVSKLLQKSGKQISFVFIPECSVTYSILLQKSGIQNCLYSFRVNRSFLLNLRKGGSG